MTAKKLLTHEEMVKKMLAVESVAEEVERLNREEYALLDRQLAERKAEKEMPLVRNE